MAFGGLDREEFSAPMAEINTTPLVDVMLVLLVIFLVTAPMLTQAVSLELPNETASVTADDNPIALSVDAEGNYFWEREALDVHELERRLQAEAQRTPPRPIHLRADRAADYGRVATLLSLAQRHNLTQIGFVMQQE